MASKPKAESNTSTTAQEGWVVVGRDWEGKPLYAPSADKPVVKQTTTKEKEE